MGKSRFKRKGKSKFIMIEGYIMRSPAWSALTPNEKTAYLELKWRYDGLNNGRIGLGCRELAEALKSSKNTAQRSLDRLVERGFIAKAKPSGFNVKNRMATEWRLTEYACDVSGHLATKDFTRWKPPEIKTQSHQEDTQSHQRDDAPLQNGKNYPHSPTTGTVRPIFNTSQSHQEDTYSITMGGRVGTPQQISLSAAPTERSRSAPIRGAEASDRVTPFKKSSSPNGSHSGKTAA